MLNVVCVNWGLKFKPQYVQVLYNMVERNLTIPHKFILFTDRINKLCCIFIMGRITSFWNLSTSEVPAFTRSDRIGLSFLVI